MRDKTANKTVVIILMLSFIANVVAICHLWKRQPVLCGHKVETIYDTIPLFYPEPVPVDSTVIRYVDVRLPVSENVRDTVFVIDSVEVQVPITQKVYSDSTYKAWVSGFHPSLDSICVYQPNTTITVIEPVVEYKVKKWGLGVQVGVGATPAKIEPYIGIGITYNILSW